MTSTVWKTRPGILETASQYSDMEQLAPKGPPSAPELYWGITSAGAPIAKENAEPNLEPVAKEASAFGPSTIPTLTIEPTISLTTQVEPASRVVAQQSVHRAIRPEVTKDAQLLLTGELSRIQHILVPIIVSKANVAGIPIKGIEWSVKADPEERWREVVCRAFVRANAPQALVFWEMVGQAISEWRWRQEKRTQRFVDEQVAVFIEWE